MKCDVIIILSFYSTFLIFGLRFGRRDYTSLKIWLERLYPAENLAGEIIPRWKFGWRDYTPLEIWLVEINITFFFLSCLFVHWVLDLFLFTYLIFSNEILLSFYHFIQLFQFFNFKLRSVCNFAINFLCLKIKKVIQVKVFVSPGIM
jgi:hypothetical protein